MAHQKRMFSWMNPKLEVRETEKYGKGVFAKEGIPKDERLAIFGGHILTLEEESQLSEELRDIGVQIAENFVLTTQDQKEDVDYCNHSCNPNAGFEGQIFLVAMKDIFPDEQVTFDYAMALFADNGSMAYSMKCECGFGDCRGVITTEDWKNQILQEKYSGYFQLFLQKRIDNLRKK